MALKIYLADLTHIGNGIATEAFPLNIGLIASQAKKKFGKDIDITLFKYPLDLLQALQEASPDILACSNYCWNSNLSYHFTQLSKSLKPEVLTVWGGTNYPFDEVSQEGFLRKHPDIDIHIFYEGELAFTNIVERALSVSLPIQVLNDSLDGCQFISPSDGSFVSGNPLPRISDLDIIPSPYTTGLMDKFFDGSLTPMMETARGCPFACNFCNAGDDYFNKINKFSDHYEREELYYIAERAVRTGVGHLTFADNNFGMVPRDANTSKLIHECQQKFDWPRSITIWTGKNSKERVIAATELLGDSISLSMSVQSMDDIVLKNIERDNIRLEDYRAIAESLARAGRPQHAEVIMPLPGETLQAHLRGLDDLLDTQVNRTISLTLTMLHGTPYKDDRDFLERYGYVNKFRLVPLDFSEIEGHYIFDVEEVGIATKDMSFEEYVDARVYLFIIDICFNSEVFKPLQRYLVQKNIKISQWIRNIFNNVNQFPAGLKKIVQSFRNETVGELWDSEEELVKYFSTSENYNALISGERGGNVLFKHRIWMLSEMNEPFVNFIFDYTRDLIHNQSKSSSKVAVNKELKSLQRFISGTLKKSYSPENLDTVVRKKIDYNVQKWMEAGEGNELKNHTVEDSTTFAFYFPEEDQKILNDGFNLYGSSLTGIIKLIQRLGKLPIRSVVEETGTSAEVAGISGLRNGIS